MFGRQQNQGAHFRVAPKKKTLSKKVAVFALACVVLSVATLGGTIAYILTNTPSLANTFTPAQMGCEIREEFTDGTEKKNVRVKNTSETSAYIRVKLLPYWYDKENDTIVAKSAWSPSFTPGEGWVLGKDGFYYYTLPVDSGASTTALISSLTLKKDDVTLSRQVLEIVASCIQAEPDSAVMDAWTGTNGSVTGVNPSTNVLMVEQQT